MVRPQRWTCGRLSRGAVREEGLRELRHKGLRPNQGRRLPPAPRPTPAHRTQPLPSLVLRRQYTERTLCGRQTRRGGGGGRHPPKVESQTHPSLLTHHAGDPALPGEQRRPCGGPGRAPGLPCGGADPNWRRLAGFRVPCHRPRHRPVLQRRRQQLRQGILCYVDAAQLWNQLLRVLRRHNSLWCDLHCSHVRCRQQFRRVRGCLHRYVRDKPVPAGASAMRLWVCSS